MKLLIAIFIMGLSATAIAQEVDSNIIEYKDWRSDKVVSHGVSEKSACVAKTTIKDSDTTLEVYSEASSDGGNVQPMVQIVTTDVAPALGVTMRMSPGGKTFPMTVSLSESKTIQKEVIVDGVATMEDVEKQVFMVKFKDKKSMIDYIRAKNYIVGKFFNSDGEISEMKFSLRGSSRSVKKMQETCL